MWTTRQREPRFCRRLLVPQIQCPCYLRGGQGQIIEAIKVLVSSMRSPQHCRVIRILVIQIQTAHLCRQPICDFRQSPTGCRIRQRLANTAKGTSATRFQPEQTHFGHRPIRRLQTKRFATAMRSTLLICSTNATAMLAHLGCKGRTRLPITSMLRYRKAGLVCFLLDGFRPLQKVTIPVAYR